MRDPEMASRANRAAVALERAWERWRIVHGLPAAARSPVSSYVGYSIEEPWGTPRVVFGVDAGEAELLAALLERHEGTGQSSPPGPAASVPGQPGHAGDALYQATRARLTGPQRAGQRPPVAAAAPAPPPLPAAPARPPAQMPVPGDGAEPTADHALTDAQPAPVHAAVSDRLTAQDAEIPGQGSLLPDPPPAGQDAAARDTRDTGEQADGDPPAGPGADDGDQAGGLLRAAGGEPAASERGDPGDSGGDGDPGGDGDRGRPGRSRAAAAQPERPGPGRTGRGKGGTESIAAELAGWASGELPGQASARLAAWQAIGGVPAADVREGSTTSLRPAGLGSPLDTPELGAADLGSTAEPVR